MILQDLTLIVFRINKTAFNINYTVELLRKSTAVTKHSGNPHL